MSDYTTKTASLKATAIDTRKIDAKQIDTKTLNINGISIDEKLKQAAIASRGNILILEFYEGIVNVCEILAKDGQVLDEPINLVAKIVHHDVGSGYKQYLLVAYNNVDSVFNIGTTVNEIIVATSQEVEEIKLKELMVVEDEWIKVFELGEFDDNLEEIYGGAFYTGQVVILYKDNAYTSDFEQQNTASTYSLRGENTSILDKLRQTVQKNS